MRRVSTSSRSLSAIASREQPPALGVRLGDDQLRLAPRLLLDVLRGALGRDERRTQQRLELDVARDLGSSSSIALGELGALAPDRLEAVGDLVDRRSTLERAVAEEATSSSRWRTSTGVMGIVPPCSADRSMSALTSISQEDSAITATIGERSSGPSGGMIRRKMRRYGSQTSYRNCCSRSSVGETARRDPRR